MRVDFKPWRSRTASTRARVVTGEELPEEEDQPPRKRIRVGRPQDYYDIVEVNEKFVRKCGATTYDYRVQFRDMNQLSLREFLPRLGPIFESIFGEVNGRSPC